ncbi:hypothetical protein [Woeseia oceani]|uniref:Uncharacterized protein n=1 Tax=Woeseia oceani TaxID=1548547 RepID=A0A193LJV2_9GAMM|nr:hypothetical protein [Woeseia oceani]ANO52713.1 hypothetical protein BA177_17310 [Woeseia oceani]
MKQRTALILASLLMTSFAHAENGDSERDRRGPPKVAVEACATAVQGDPCSFADREGEILEGSCDAPDDRPLACRPAGGPPGLSPRSQ